MDKETDGPDFSKLSFLDGLFRKALRRQPSHLSRMVAEFTQEPALNCVQVRDNHGGKP
jgi:hypothetical protein